MSSQLTCNFLSNLGYDDIFTSRVIEIVQNHMKLLSIGDSEKGLKKLLNNVGDEVFEKLMFFREADTQAK